MANIYQPEPVALVLERSDGVTFRIDGESGWMVPLDGLDGWAMLDLDVNTSPNVLTDGSSLVSKRVNEKDRTARATYLGADNAAARAQAISFFNPKFTFKAHLTYKGRTRWCEGELYAFECPQRNVNLPTQITFTLLCLDPFMRDIDGNESAFGDSVPMFGFPFVSHVQEELSDGAKYPVGFMASELIYDGKNTVWNNGDVETAYTVRVTAKGTLENPTITKDGRHVRMLLTLYEGDVLDIDFTAAPPRVEKNGQNVIHYASRDSAFTKMQMQVGKNVFSFTVDNEENRSLAKVQVLFHKKYLGV